MIYGFLFSVFLRQHFISVAICLNPQCQTRQTAAAKPDQARKGTAFGGISDAFYRGQTTFYSQ